jgi:hypothetical protein
LPGIKIGDFSGAELSVKKPGLVYRIRTCKKTGKTAPDPFFEGKPDFRQKIGVYPPLK